MPFIESIFETVDSLMVWLGTSLKQTTNSYCDLETADSEYNLASTDGSLISIIRVNGVSILVGRSEFLRLHEGLGMTLRSVMKGKQGHNLQIFFQIDQDNVETDIARKLGPASDTVARLGLQLDDLLNERKKHLAKYCAYEELYLVVWTKPTVLSPRQQKASMSKKISSIRQSKMQPFPNAQNILAPIAEIRDEHNSIVQTILGDLQQLSVSVSLMEVHDAIRAIRKIVDYDFTSEDWSPSLPGDKLPFREGNGPRGDISDILWPPLGKQILSRDAENLDLRTCRIGDRIFSSVFIDLFPQEVRPFQVLFSRIAATRIPWRVSFRIESGGTSIIRYKSVIAAILSFASTQNRLLSNAYNLLQEIDINTDDAVVSLRVSFSTWAPDNDFKKLRIRTAELAKAIQGWGTCEVSEICGDPFAAIVANVPALTEMDVATRSVAPLSDVTFMLPFYRPGSPWRSGAVLFRSTDGKVWPYQPGSSTQTTWIDLLYARPGSGKSVLSNSINLALCLGPGIKSLPRIAIIDIGPSSSGLISLLKEALPEEKSHLVTYQRLEMRSAYAINPFDTQLGARFPTPQERSFLVNLLSLLATPVAAARPYDGIGDLVGIVIDEMYKDVSDENNPKVYVLGSETLIDDILEEIGFRRDPQTSWWEVTDTLFLAGFTHEARLAQRHAVPHLSDATTICRLPAIEDLYGKVISPTGEQLITAFGRMISSAVREYPILSTVTAFDLSDSLVVSLDLDEVAKSGGEAADRQTAVMYMLARYVLAKDFYLTDSSLSVIPEIYQKYHKKRIDEIRESSKRIVYDEFHRTARSPIVRDQVILDMREGRKWNVQIALISQSVDDFNETIIEFATSVFIMDAGPEQAIAKSSKIFGLSETARAALRQQVHGPRRGGATFLAQFFTKEGSNMQLLTNTIGPIELWAFTTTTEDAYLRDQLYAKIGARETRQLLANLFPEGTVKPILEKRLEAAQKYKETSVDLDIKGSLIDELLETILNEYAKNRNVQYIKFD